MDILSIVLERLAWTSVQSAVLVGVVWLVLRALPRLPAATRCTLWWLVALQAVIGLAWANPLELAVLPAAQAPQVLEQTAFVLPAVDAVTAADAAAARSVMPEATAPAVPGIVTVLMALWLTGVLAMTTWTLRGWLQTRRLLRDAVACADAGLVSALQMAAQAHGLRRAPALKLSAHIDSPQLIGPWRPVLLLPARQLERLQGDALDMALTHELVHLQRRDLWFGLVPALAQHLFFFHPLVHLAVREYAIQREVACDAAVVEGHRHCRHDYGQLLLQLGIAPRPVVGVASASPTYVSLKRRLQMLQQAGSLPRTVSWLVIATVLAVGVAPLRLVAAAPPAPPAPPAAPEAPDAPAAPASLPAPDPMQRTPLIQLSPVSPVAPAIEAPPAPAAPPAPPAPPAAPLAPLTSITTHGRVDLSTSPREAFVLVTGNNDHFVDGSVADIRQARRDSGGQRSLWVRRGDARYLIRDPSVLARIQKDYADVAVLGRRQAEVANRQAALAAVESQRAMIEADAAREAARAVRDLDVEGIRREAAAAAREAQQAMQEAGGARQQAARAAEQAVEQAEMAREQERASARAHAAVQAAIKAAIENGTAQRLE